MSDIRFNQWLHNSGTGGVSQVDGGHVGIGTTNPLIPVGSGNTAILNVGVVTANSFYGDGSNLSGVQVGGASSLSFNDNIGAYWGNSQDLKIYHDGNHSYIDDQGTGNLRFRSGTLEILNLAGNKTSATFSSGGGQTLNFNNSTKFVTTNTGVVVTGILTATSLTINDYIYHHGDTNTFIGFESNDTIRFNTNGSDKLKINSSGHLILADDNDTYIHHPAADSLAITTGGSERLRITSEGYVRIGGTIGNYPLNVIETSNRTTTAAPTIGLYAKHDGSGNTGVGFGGGIKFWGDRNGDNARQTMGNIMCVADVNSGTNLSGALTFETSTAGTPSEKLRIDSSGRVLINTTNNSNGHISASKLAVQGADLSIFKDSGGDNAGVSGHKLKFVTQSGSLGEIDVLSEGGGGPSGRGGAMLFYTKANNIASATERMRLTSDGMMSIGKTSNAGKAIEIYQGTYAALRIQNSSTGTGNNDGVLLEAAGSDCLLYNYESANIKFGTAGTHRTTIDSSGHLQPAANNTYDLGSSSLRWRNVYTTDLQLSNEGKSNDVDGTWGDYTIQEGESELFLINNRSGKKYVFLLKEVS